MNILRRVAEMETLPRGYGRAWRVDPELVWVCAPVGLHLILGLVRSAYLWLKCLYVPSYVERVFDRGYTLGKAHGAERQALRELQRLEASRRAAYRQGKDHMLAWLMVDLEIDRAERSERMH